jgi:hypothetical protein
LATLTGLTGPATLSPDGKALVGPTEGGFKVWDAATGREQAFCPGARGGVFFPDARSVLAATSTGAKCWDLVTGAEQYVLHCRHLSPIDTLEFSADGETLVSRTPATKELRTVMEMGGLTKGRWFSFGSRWEEVRDSDGRLKGVVEKRWDVSTGQEVPVTPVGTVGEDRPESDEATGAVFLPNPAGARARALRQQDRDDAAPAVKKGRVLLRQGLLDEAETAFGQALQQQPGAAEAQFLLGAALLRKDRLPRHRPPSSGRRAWTPTGPGPSRGSAAWSWPTSRPRPRR